MLKDRELENQMTFLEEANNNLDTLESVLLDIKPLQKISVPQINTALKAIHFIKSGAGKMKYSILSDCSLYLENFLQVLKIQANSLEIDADLHSLLVSIVDWLRQILKLLSLGHIVDIQWLSTFCYPVFEELQKRLYPYILEINMGILSLENQLHNIIPLLFQTEVEECLQHLEALLTAGKKSVFKAETMMIATQLASLGEILQIPAFVKLCDSIIRYLKTTDSEEATVEIAKLALLAWRRSQELILKNQWELLPTKIVWHQTKNSQEIEVQLISLCSGNV